MVESPPDMASGDHEVGSQAKLHCSRGCSKSKEKGRILAIWPELQHGEGMGSEGCNVIFESTVALFASQVVYKLSI